MNEHESNQTLIKHSYKITLQATNYFTNDIYKHHSLNNKPWMLNINYTALTYNAKSTYI